MEYSVTVLPALETLLNMQVVRPEPEPPAPGRALCLTNNEDLPADERQDTGAAIALDQPVQGGLAGAKLFDGQIEGPAHNLGPGPYPVWSVTVDLGQAYQIDRAEICMGICEASRLDCEPSLARSTRSGCAASADACGRATSTGIVA